VQLVLIAEPKISIGWFVDIRTLLWHCSTISVYIEANPDPGLVMDDVV
jgi:hypothetical protein